MIVHLDRLKSWNYDIRWSVKVIDKFYNHNLFYMLIYHSLVVRLNEDQARHTHKLKKYNIALTRTY